MFVSVLIAATSLPNCDRCLCDAHRRKASYRRHSVESALRTVKRKSQKTVRDADPTKFGVWRADVAASASSLETVGDDARPPEILALLGPQRRGRTFGWPEVLVRLEIGFPHVVSMLIRMSVAIHVAVPMGLRHHRLDFRHRHHRQEPAEEQKQREEQAQNSQSASGCRSARAQTCTNSIGRKSRVSEVMMISNRSNHMPMLAKTATDEQQQHVRPHLLEPEELRRDHVAPHHDEERPIM